MVEARSSQHADETLELVCAEIWGGNRYVDLPFRLPGVRGHIYSRPCDGGRGGDVHCLSICGSGLIARMCLADVVGHGEHVATVAQEIHTLLRRHLNALDQRRILRRLNRRLAAKGIGRMTTAAMLTYLPTRRSLSVSYAGHPPGWIYRRGTGMWQRLTTDSTPDAALLDLPLAVEGAARFSRQQVTVNEGDRLLLVTDGVLEAAGPDGRILGEERFAELLGRVIDAAPDAVSETLVTELARYAGGAEHYQDDVSLLIAEFVPGPRSMLWEMVKNRIRRPHGNSAQVAPVRPAGA